MDRIFSPPAGHVAGCAIGLTALGMARNGNRRVAAHTFGAILRNRGVTPRHIVRIVASGAGKRSLALAEAHRLPQPVSLTYYLELIPATGPGRLVEVHHIRAQRFARPERKRLALRTAYHSGQLRAGGLQVALHTDVHLQLRTQPRRIDDSGPDFLPRRSSARGQLRMTRSGAMAALTVDALSQGSAGCWIAVVTE